MAKEIVIHLVINFSILLFLMYSHGYWSKIALGVIAMAYSFYIIIKYAIYIADSNSKKK